MAQSPADVTAKLEGQGIQPDTKSAEVPQVEVSNLEDGGFGDEGFGKGKLGSRSPNLAQRSEEEVLASARGWKPEDKFDGDPTDWVPAKQFLRQGEQLNKIHNQNRKIKKMETAIDGLAKQHKKMFSAGYEKAKKELRGAYREAIHEGDDAKAQQVEQAMDNLDQRAAVEAANLPQEQSQQTELNDVFVDWVGNNEWFMKRPDMRSYAESVGLEHAKANPNISNSEVYAHVTRETKKKFPERFPDYIPDNEDDEAPRPRQRKASAVEGDLPRTRGTARMDRVELSSEEKEVGRTLVRRGEYKNMAEYAADVVKYNR